MTASLCVAAGSPPDVDNDGRKWAPLGSALNAQVAYQQHSLEESIDPDSPEISISRTIDEMPASETLVQIEKVTWVPAIRASDR